MHVPTNLRENCRSESSLLYTKGKTEIKKQKNNVLNR